jgi:hypothetical protein
MSCNQQKWAENWTHFGLTWNVLNNWKSMENPKKLQLQKLFQITPSFSTIFLGIFIIPSLFFSEIFRFQQLFESGKFNPMAHLSVALRPAPALPVGGRGAHRHHTPTELSEAACL